MVLQGCEKIRRKREIDYNAPLMSVPNATESSKRAALVIAAASSFITPFMGSAINIGLPAVGAEFQIDAVLLSWVETVYLLVVGVFLLPMGKLADIHGRKKFFTIGISIYIVGTILSGIAFSEYQLIAFRVIQGIGSAMIFSTSIAILTSIFPPSERGKVLGISVAAVYTGLSIGPFLGGILTEHWGWRSIFLTTVPLGLLALVLVLVYLKGEWAEAKGEKFDIAGSIILGLALIALILGLSVIPSLLGAWLIPSGIVLLAIFIMWETRVKNPVLSLSLLAGNRTFAFSNLAALINYSATFAVTFILSLYLQYIKEMTPQQAGTVLVVQPILMAITSPFAGRLSDKIEPRIVSSVGMTLSVIGLIPLIFLSDTTSFPVLTISLILLGLGFGIFSSPNTNAIMGSVEKKYYGVASAMVGTMRVIGQMLSMGTVMMLFSMIIGRVQIVEENYPQFLVSIRTAFVIFTVLCTFGIFASLARGRLR